MGFQERPSRLQTGLFVILAVSFFFLGCEEDTEKNPLYERGDLIRCEENLTYTTEQIKQMISFFDLDLPSDLSYPVTGIKIVYQTVDPNNEKTIASGALLVPEGGYNSPFLSLQHGTETSRQKVASLSPVNSPEGLIGLVAASMGYLCGVPDYLGFGESVMIHPFLHATSSSTVTIDFLRAAMEYCNKETISLSGDLFLGGYSEGGYVTLATQKDIELNYSDEFNLTAVAPMAGPFDLAGSMTTILETPGFSRPYYIAFFLTAYNNVYKWNRLDGFFVDPYGSLMNDLFSGEYEAYSIENQLPQTLSELLDPQFVSDFMEGEETELENALIENRLLNWIPVTPMRLFHAVNDEIVPYQNSLSAYNAFNTNSDLSIELISWETGGHMEAFIPSILGMFDWFDSITFSNEITVLSSPE